VRNGCTLSTCLPWGGTTIVQGALSLRSCTFAANRIESAHALAGAGSQVNAVNCIFWGNGPIPSLPTSATATWSDVEGGWPGIGNIDADPLFADPSNGDLHLTAASPCRNAGEPAVPGVTSVSDFEGNPRVWESAPDIGADEYVAPLPGTGDDL